MGGRFDIPDAVHQTLLPGIYLTLNAEHYALSPHDVSYNYNYLNNTCIFYFCQQKKTSGRYTTRNF